MVNLSYLLPNIIIGLKFNPRPPCCVILSLADHYSLGKGKSIEFEHNWYEYTKDLPK